MAEGNSGAITYATASKISVFGGYHDYNNCLWQHSKSEGSQKQFVCNSPKNIPSVAFKYDFQYYNFEVK